MLPAVVVWSSNHWTTGEFLHITFFLMHCLNLICYYFIQKIYVYINKWSKLLLYFTILWVWYQAMSPHKMGWVTFPALWLWKLVSGTASGCEREVRRPHPRLWSGSYRAHRDCLFLIPNLKSFGVTASLRGTSSPCSISQLVSPRPKSLKKNTNKTRLPSSFHSASRSSQV